MVASCWLSNVIVIPIRISLYYLCKITYARLSLQAFRILIPSDICYNRENTQYIAHTRRHTAKLQIFRTLIHQISVTIDGIHNISLTQEDKP